MTAIDPALYAHYHKTADFSIQGCHAKWTGVPAAAMLKIWPVIKASAAIAADSYDTSLDRGSDYVYLNLLYRGVPTGDEILALESMVCGLMIATRWGGP